MNDLAFFEPNSVLTAGGASFVIQLVANTLAQFGVGQRWTAGLLSLVLAGLNADPQLNVAWLILMTVINACFLFCTALGLSQSFRQVGGGGLGFGATRDTAWTRFFSSWF
ncbi:hypothetical protein H2509_05210 [Stappia sp. F7233]|uniref:Uncharacterized protein n=1 Tax=Stappia albiluteola TaxID=2758565 RepID=A0A839AA45_9HYPH|nr:hypothetical protein [Stappia albiluteola]MBA5776520.1 hypothetical protein [Stappia albiluteola]